MRRLPLLALAACGSAPAPVARPAPATVDVPVATPRIGLPSLTTPGTLFLVTTTGTQTSCTPYTVAPKPSARTQLISGPATIELVVTGNEVELTGWRHGTASSTCGFITTATETTDAIVIDGAHWFRTEAACTRALASKARVAMDWRGCDLDPPVPEAVATATRARLEEVLSSGGTLYTASGDMCAPLNVTARGRTAHGGLDAELWYRVTHDRLTHTVTHAVTYFPGHPTLSLNGTSGHLSDGTMYGAPSSACRREAHLELLQDAVDIGSRVYLTKESCTRALADERARQAHLPLKKDVLVTDPMMPSIGC